MAGLNKIIQEIPSDYKKQKKINGVLRDTYFFKTWGGYHHPIHMQKPLSYAETQKREGYAYYEASLDTSGNHPLLIFVEKFTLHREPIIVDENKLTKGKAGDIYYLYRKQQNHVILDKEIELDDTFVLKEYVHVLQDTSGRVLKAELARKKFNYSYEYEYDEKGIKRVTVRYPEDTKVIDRGQPQVF